MSWSPQDRREAHAENIRRYRKLLRTRLSETEQRYVERRLQEEQQAYFSLLQPDTSTRTQGRETGRDRP